MIGEWISESLQWRRQQGLACNHAGFGQLKVGKGREWDMQQLSYIAEIAERLGKGEDVLVVADFWGAGNQGPSRFAVGPGPTQGGQRDGQRF